MTTTEGRGQRRAGEAAYESCCRCCPERVVVDFICFCFAVACVVRHSHQGQGIWFCRRRHCVEFLALRANPPTCPRRSAMSLSAGRHERWNFHRKRSSDLLLPRPAQGHHPDTRSNMNGRESFATDIPDRGRSHRNTRRPLLRRARRSNCVLTKHEKRRRRCRWLKWLRPRRGERPGSSVPRNSGLTVRLFFTIPLLFTFASTAGGLAPGLALNPLETGW